MKRCNLNAGQFNCRYLFSVKIEAFYRSIDKIYKGIPIARTAGFSGDVKSSVTNYNRTHVNSSGHWQIKWCANYYYYYFHLVI